MDMYRWQYLLMHVKAEVGAGASAGVVHGAHGAAAPAAAAAASQLTAIAPTGEVGSRRTQRLLAASPRARSVAINATPEHFISAAVKGTHPL